MLADVTLLSWVEMYSELHCYLNTSRKHLGGGEKRTGLTCLRPSMTARETLTWSANSPLPCYAEVAGFPMSLPDGFTLSPDNSAAPIAELR